MAERNWGPKVHEMVALFHDRERLETALGELESAGVDRAEISLLARSEDAEAPLRPSGTPGAEDDPRAPREAATTDTDVRQGRTLATSLGAVVAAFAASGLAVMTGGAAAAAISAAVLAGGGVAFIGATAGEAAGKRHAAFLQEQLERGGILLWVKVRDAAQEPKIAAILESHGASDVHAHDVSVYPSAS